MDDTYIAQQLVKFNIPDSAIERLKENYSELIIIDANDVHGYKMVRAARMEIKKLRVEVDKRRKELTEDALKYQRAINGEAKRITALLSPIEEDLEAKEKAHEEEKERIRKEKEAEENRKLIVRDRKLGSIGYSFNGELYASEVSGTTFTIPQLKEFPDELFEEIYDNLEQAFNIAMKKAHEAEQERIEQERKEEQERLEQEEEAKKQRAEQAEKDRLERERLEIEKAELINAQNQLRKEQERLAEERKKIEGLKKESPKADVIFEARPDNRRPISSVFDEPIKVVPFTDEKETQEYKVLDTSEISKKFKEEIFNNMKSGFTQEQKDFICYQIGLWYVSWKDMLVNFEDRTHKLGYAKELLKTMICGE